MFRGDISKSGLALAGLLMAASGAASAQDGPSIGFGLTGATDYVWRGYTQSDENPAIFGSVNIGWGDFYAGAGAENVDFLGIDTEYDVWAGWKRDLGGVTLDVGLVRYGYLDAPSGLDLDTLEAKLALSGTAGAVAWGAAIFMTDDYFATEDSASYVEISGSVPIHEAWSASGALGHQTIDAGSDYTTWNAGVRYAVAENAALDLRYHDTDADNSGGAADSRIVFSFSITM